MKQKPFDEGTNFVMKAVKNNNNKNFFSVAGGGDTISLLNHANASDYFSLFRPVVVLFLSSFKAMGFLV